MKGKWIGIAAVTAIAVGIVAYKSSNRPDTAKVGSATQASSLALLNLGGGE